MLMATGSLAVQVDRLDGGADTEPVWIGLVACGETAKLFSRDGKGDPLAASAELYRRSWIERDGARREASSLSVEPIDSTPSVSPNSEKRVSGRDRQQLRANKSNYNDADHEFDAPPVASGPNTHAGKWP